MTTSTCPECDGVIAPSSNRCACGWQAPRQPPRIVYQREPMTPGKAMPTAMKEALKDFGVKGRYWTPERVRNQAQARFIKLQADRFGDVSQAGRFFHECVERGCMNRDGLYLGPAQPLREPGEDAEDAA